MTSLLVPLMSCSARLPVYVVFGLAFFGAAAASVITGLYVVLVPILGLLRRQFPHFTIWLAVIMAAAGLHRNITNADTSSTCAWRLIAIAACIMPANGPVEGFMSVSTGPG